VQNCSKSIENYSFKHKTSSASGVFAPDPPPGAPPHAMIYKIQLIRKVYDCTTAESGKLQNEDQKKIKQNRSSQIHRAYFSVYYYTKYVLLTVGCAPALAMCVLLKILRIGPADTASSTSRNHKYRLSVGVVATCNCAPSMGEVPWISAAAITCERTESRGVPSAPYRPSWTHAQMSHRRAVDVSGKWRFTVTYGARDAGSLKPFLPSRRLPFTYLRTGGRLRLTPARRDRFAYKIIANCSHVDFGAPFTVNVSSLI